MRGLEPLRQKSAHREDGGPGDKSWLRQLGAGFIAGEAEEGLWRGRGARREELAAKEGCSV